MNFNIITVLYNHQYYLIPEFFPYPDKETPHSLAEPHCHPSPVPWKPLIYSISVNCLFWTCRWNHAKVSLCIWLISLNLFSRFTLVVVSIRTLFLYRITIYLYGFDHLWGGANLCITCVSFLKLFMNEFKFGMLKLLKYVWVWPIFLNTLSLCVHIYVYREQVFMNTHWGKKTDISQEFAMRIERSFWMEFLSVFHTLFPGFHFLD